MGTRKRGSGGRSPRKKNLEIDAEPEINQHGYNSNNVVSPSETIRFFLINQKLFRILGWAWSTPRSDLVYRSISAPVE